jgi:predicted HD phosphohydrolase
MSNAIDIPDTLINIYKKYGNNDYIGEPITQLEHAIQCFIIAQNDPRLREYDDFTQKCIIVASFLHDIGHIISYDTNNNTMEKDKLILGIQNHEEIGSKYLKELGFPSLVCELVSNHVLAKRYLATVKPKYYNTLSDASKKTMEIQGGIMSNEEIKKFKMGVSPDLKLLVRKYDDLGKRIDWKLNHDEWIIEIKKCINTCIMYGRLYF